MNTRSRVQAGAKAVHGKLAPGTPHNCRDCNIILVSRRIKSRSGVTRQHNGRGLCMICARARRNAGQSTEGPRLPAPRSTTRWKCRALLAEYELLRRKGCSKREVAALVGMNLASLNRALCRARRALERDARLAAYLVELLAAEIEAHRINDDMNAYALRKAS